MEDGQGGDGPHDDGDAVSGDADSRESVAPTSPEAGEAVDGARGDDVADPGVDVDVIVAEEAAASRRLSSIEAGRRKGGTAGAAMAGAMLALSEIYEGPKRDEIVAVSESPDEPTDIDDGIRVDVGDVTVESHPPERDEP